MKDPVYEKFVMESFDLLPSNQYILVRVIPGCFRFAKMCLCQIIDLLSRCSSRYLTSSSKGTGLSSYGECDVDRLGIVSFHSPFLKPVSDCS
jgi:hypothetical protein